MVSWLRRSAIDFGLDGRHVVVTGASGKIGSAIAIAFAREGARVAIGYRDNGVSAARTATEVAAVGGEATLFRADLGVPEALVEAVDELRRSGFSQIDVLVNNAVSWPPRLSPESFFEDVTLDDLRDSLEANVIGHYALTQLALPSMRANSWGRIVFVSTGLVVDGLPRSSLYTSPKAALHGLSRTLSRELASQGILTNVVMAGFVPSDGVPASILKEASLSAATGRTTNAWEVANLVTFLGSEANGHITGEAIRADGHFLTRA